MSTKELKLLKQLEMRTKFAAHGNGAWTCVYKSWRNADDDGAFFAAFAPKKSREHLLGNSSWDLSIGDGMPGFSQYASPKRTKYHRFGNSSEVEPIVLLQEHYGMKPRMLPQICEEFRLYHNLWISPNGRTLAKIEEARIVWTGDVSEGAFGSLTLGMSRDAVRELFAGPFRTFARGGYGLDLDQFLGRGIMVTFGDDKSVFVELASPSQPSYQGVELLERQVRHVVLDLTHQGHVVVQVDSGRYDIVGPPWVGLYVEFDVVKGVSFGDRSRG